MNGRLLEVIEVANPTDKLRCYVEDRGEGPPRVKARLLRGGKIVEENVFLFDARLPLAELRELLETTLREIATAAGGRLRMMAKAERLTAR